MSVVKYLPSRKTLGLFFKEFKTSSVGLAVGYIAGILGTILPSLPYHAKSLIIGLLLIGAPLGYYIYYRPFGVECIYRPTDFEAGRPALSKEKEKIAIPEDGIYRIPFKLSTEENIKELHLKLLLPQGVEEPYFVDYERDVESFDYARTELHIPDAENIIEMVVILIEESDLDHRDINKLSLVHVESGRKIESVKLVSTH